MRIKCPHCGVSGPVNPSWQGRPVKCPRCVKIFGVPVLAGRQGSASPTEDDEAATVILPEAGLLAADTASPQLNGLSEMAAVPGPGTAHEVPAAVVSEVEVESLREPLRHAADDDDDGSAVQLGVPVEDALQAELAVLLSESCRLCGKNVAETGADAVQGQMLCRACADQNRTPEALYRTGQTLAGPRSQEAGQSSGNGLTISSGLSRLDAGAVLWEAWKLTSGMKTPVWIALVLVSAALFALAGMTVFLLPSAGARGGRIILTWVIIGLQLIGMMVFMAFLAGLINIGIRRVAGTPVAWTLAFSGFRRFGSVVAAGLLMSLMITSGFFLLILPGIYLAVSYSLTFSLVVDKGYGPWQAMEASRQMIQPWWWQVSGIYLAMLVIHLISCLPFGLGAIWTIPMFFTLSGVLYRVISAGQVPSATPLPFR